jgi:hypothetical protein
MHPLLSIKQTDSILGDPKRQIGIRLRCELDTSKNGMQVVPRQMGWREIRENGTIDHQGQEQFRTQG